MLNARIWMNLLKPSLYDFSYLDCRRRSHLLRGEASKLSRNTEVLLDVGGRGKPYAPLFKDRIHHYYVMDLESERTVDVVGNAKNMPFRSGSIDVALCTQVLEHSNEPEAVVAEIWRVLKCGGVLFLSTPGIFPQHGSPGDYFRYMPQGLEYLLRDFSEIDIRPEAGTLASFFLVFNMYLSMFSAGSSLLQTLTSWVICPITNSLGLLAGKIYRGKQFASNYFVVAIR